MEKICKKCSSSFTVSDRDLSFYKKISPTFSGRTFSIPVPVHCPDCRMQRRLTFRNERKLYHRKSDFGNKNIISIYSVDKPHKVYEQEVWWGDGWDPMESGFEFDFSKGFFEQFAELLLRSPLINLSNTLSENCAYTHNASRNKDCYLTFCASFNEGCLYSYFMQNNRDSADCNCCQDCELCYECVDCYGSYRLNFSQNCRNCSDSYLLLNCSDCQNCVGCVNQRGKSYCWFNEQLSEDQFKRRVPELRSRAYFRETLDRFRTFSIEFPRPWSEQQMTEDCIGDYIYESKHCHDCFEIKQSEDCAYCQNMVKSKDCYDVTFFGLPGELLYECNNIGINAYNCLFSNYGYGCQNIYYCYNTHFCKNCFGCVSLHHKEYCIFNRQYEAKEYETLCARIAEHMQKSGEWGQFLPVQLSPFAYNETGAHEYFPLSKAKAIEEGFAWREEEDEKLEVSGEIESVNVPDTIQSISDDILTKAIKCQATGRPFRVVKPELEFYRKTGTPLPLLHPDERHYRRMARRNPRRLFQRSCSNCQAEIQSPIDPAWPDLVYCEKCFLSEIY